jgi:hypothetical protein
MWGAELVCVIARSENVVIVVCLRPSIHSVLGYMVAAINTASCCSGGWLRTEYFSVYAKAGPLMQATTDVLRVCNNSSTDPGLQVKAKSHLDAVLDQEDPALH